MAQVMSDTWREQVQRMLEADPEFHRNARALSGTIYIYDENRGVSVRIDRGSVLELTEGPDPRGSDFRLGGTHEAWERHLGGEADIHEATAGGLTLDGDQVRVFGNALAFRSLWNALKRAAAV